MADNAGGGPAARCRLAAPRKRRYPGASGQLGLCGSRLGGL